MIRPLPTFPALFWTTPSPEPRMFPSHLAFSHYRAFEHVAATPWEYLYLSLHLDFLGGSEQGLIPGMGRSPGKGNGWLPTPVFLPGEFHGQSYSPWC